MKDFENKHENKHENKQTSRAHVLEEGDVPQHTIAQQVYGCTLAFSFAFWPDQSGWLCFIDGVGIVGIESGDVSSNLWLIQMRKTAAIHCILPW